MSTVESPSSSIATECLNHLECESEALAALNESLIQVGDRLRSNDTEELPGLVESQSERMKQVALVRERRQLLRTRIAAEQAIPEDDVSILKWAETLAEPERSSILDKRHRLMQLVDESSRLANNNMAMVQSGMLVLQRILECLTGEDGRSDRYASDGQIRSQSHITSQPNHGK